MIPAKAFCTTFIIVLANCTFTFGQSTKPENLPVIVCHRGANRIAPENTFASARKAIDAGAGFVEMDVRKNMEKELWVLHDPWLGRTTDGHGLMMFRKNSYLDSLSAGCWFGKEFCGEKIPRFKEYMERIAGKTNLYIDFKSGNVEKAIGIIRDNNMEDNVFMGFWTRRNIRLFRKSAPDIKLKMNAGSIHKVKRLKRIFHVNIIEIPKKKVSGDFISNCHSLGVEVMVYYKHNDQEILRFLLNSGIDYLNINDLEGTLRIISEITSDKGIDN